MKFGGNHETKDHKDRAASNGSNKDRDRPKKTGFGAFVFYSIEQDVKMETTIIEHEKSIAELEQALAPRPCLKQLSPIWATLEKLDDWMLMSVKQSSSKGFGILDIGATSSIMGIDAAEKLRDIIYDQTGNDIKMDVSQKAT